MATRTRRHVSHVSPFESLESRTMFAVTPFSTAISTAALQPIQTSLVTRPIPTGSNIGTIVRLNGGFDTFTIRDAASDDTPDRALAGGALRVSFSGSFQGGTTVAVQAVRNGAVVATVATLPATGVNGALVNLRSTPLTAGQYEFRAVGTGTLGLQTTSASFPIAIQATS